MTRKQEIEKLGRIAHYQAQADGRRRSIVGSRRAGKWYYLIVLAGSELESTFRWQRWY
jgi:hypothetical protein